MSIFGSIMNKIFHHGADGAPAAPAAAGDTPAATAGAPAAQVSTASAPAAAPAAAPVDVEAVLSAMAAKAGQKLDWRHSIVDLMKLLDLDSSLAARKELAHELNFTGDTNDSASMNIWLHKQVMQKLADNGGKVPDDLKR
jgi:zona occludens toxin (predicted ATPase)